MKAMILAAGRGTRLLPLTATTPKALVQVHGHALLEHVILRLKENGYTEIIINVHHLADQIIDFVRRQNAFGIRIEFSHEPELLNTGGGLKNAAWFFDDRQPFLVHNVDILSDIDLSRLRQTHRETGALVTLAVKERPTTRFFLFDEGYGLVGWKNAESGEIKMARRPSGRLRAIPFLGIHQISPELFQLMTETGAFSIVDVYLRLAREGHPILGFPCPDAKWLDLGRKENFARIQELFGEKFPP